MTSTKHPPQAALTEPLRPLAKTPRELTIAGTAQAPPAPVQAQPEEPIPIATPAPPAPVTPATQPAAPDVAPATPTATARRRKENDDADPLLASLLDAHPSTKTAPITRLDPGLHATLRLISARTGMSIQDLVNGAVRSWLRDNQRTLIDHGVMEN